MRVKEFSQEIFEAIFKLYKEVNRSHWKVPDFETVTETLLQDGKYEFCATENWSSKLVFEKTTGGVKVSFVPREDLAENMQEHLKSMKRRFEEEVKNIGKK